MNDEQLRQRLREGDPATGENGLNPGEIQAMRRAVLTAAPEPRRRLLPALALAGAAVAAALIAFFILRPGPVPPAPPRIAAVPAQPPAPTALRQPSATRTETPAPNEEKKEKKRPIPRRRHLRAAPEETPTLAALDPAGNPPEEPGIRQIQFSAPGGTRIIWTLTSGKASR